VNVSINLAEIIISRHSHPSFSRCARDLQLRSGVRQEAATSTTMCVLALAGGWRVVGGWMQPHPVINYRPRARTLAFAGLVLSGRNFGCD